MKTHFENFSERSPSRLKPRFDRLILQEKRRAATRRLDEYDEEEFYRI